MSRVDDNNDFLERMKRLKFQDSDLALITSVLFDISQSLAIIAEAYVRPEIKMSGFEEERGE